LKFGWQRRRDFPAAAVAAKPDFFEIGGLQTSNSYGPENFVLNPKNI